MSSAAPTTRCTGCGTELPPGAVACPACQTLVFGDRLRQLAQAAETATRDDQLETAKTTWERALELLPADSRQHEVIRGKVRDLETRLAARLTPEKPRQAHGVWWKRILGGAVAVALLFAGKLKFILLGLSKAGTLLSMFAFFGVYWTTFGWPLALGLVISIYIHEMGHVAELRRAGIAAGAPLFIPGLGAMILLRKHIDDPVLDARIGLAGPLWGLATALAAFGIHAVTRQQVWFAIAELGAWINLFNLIPIWQLDGSRGFHALSRPQRWAAVGVIAATFAVTSQKFLIIVGAVAIFRAFQKTTTPGHPRTLAVYSALVVALAWMSRTVR